MEEELRKAIKILAKEIKRGVSSNDALKYTQAALNAANALIGLSNMKDT